MCCSVLQCYRMLQCVVVCCSVMQCHPFLFSSITTASTAVVLCYYYVCVAVQCSAMQCVAVCCSVLQCDLLLFSGITTALPGMINCYSAVCVAVCCSVLQHVAVCCIVLQCVAVRTTFIFEHFNSYDTLLKFSGKPQRYQLRATGHQILPVAFSA